MFDSGMANNSGHQFGIASARFAEAVYAIHRVAKVFDGAGGGGSRAEHKEEELAGVNSFTDFVQECQSTRGHGDVVPPDFEAAGGKVSVQAGDEGFVIAAGVGEENRSAHPIAFRRSLGLGRVILSGLLLATTETKSREGAKEKADTLKG
jgi:hypothetical protein